LPASERVQLMRHYRELAGRVAAAEQAWIDAEEALEAAIFY